MGVVSSLVKGVLKLVFRIVATFVMMVVRFVVLLVLLVFVLGAVFGETGGDVGLEGKLAAGVKSVESVYGDFQKYSELATRFRGIGDLEKIITNPDALANFNGTADLLDQEGDKEGMQKAVSRVLSKSPDEMLSEAVAASRAFSASPDELISNLEENTGDGNLSQAAEEQFSRADELMENLN